MAKKNSEASPIDQLGAFDPQSGEMNVIIETPKGNRNKFKYDDELGMFRINKVLPAGAVFPFDFGFVPSTLGQDGDPLDVLVLMDEPAFTGCLVRGRLVGVIEAEETENGTTRRNDRLVAVAAVSQNHKDMTSLKEVGESLIREIEYFFTSYSRIEGKEWKSLGHFGPKRAQQLVDEGIKEFQKRNKSQPN